MLSAGIARIAVSKRRNEASGVAARTRPAAAARSGRKRSSAWRQTLARSTKMPPFSVAAVGGSARRSRGRASRRSRRRERARGSSQRLDADVAVAGIGALGPDAEHDDAACGRAPPSAARVNARSAIAWSAGVRRGSDRRRRRCAHASSAASCSAGAVLRPGGQQDARRAAAAQPLDVCASLLLVRDDARRLPGKPRVGDRSGATRCLLEQRLVLVADAERQVLLRVQRAAERPQARAAATGEDHRHDRQHRCAAHGSGPPWSARSLRSAEICERSATYSRSLRARNACVRRRRWRIPAGVST